MTLDDRALAFWQAMQDHEISTDDEVQKAALLRMVRIAAAEEGPLREAVCRYFLTTLGVQLTIEPW